MDYITPYRKPEFIKKLAGEIAKISVDKEIKIMEVCGTHTMAIRRFGINQILPENIKLLSGPGCPVCVTPTSYIDTAIKLAERSDVVVVTFGDMVRVPGTTFSLEKAKAKGARVEIVYSPMQALHIAEKHREKKIVFLAVGFETTAPSIAVTVLEARKRRLKNFFILEGNKLIPPAIEMILKDKELKVDGFILPGHVCTITGWEIFKFISNSYNTPSTVAGFEPVDILLAIRELIKMIRSKTSKIKNLYPRAVRPDGNLKAKRIVETVFMKNDSSWRGLGVIKESGLFLRSDFKEFNILNSVEVGKVKSHDNPSCLCGEVLKGKSMPTECSLFGKICTPETPKGPCMVSSEGTCAAYFKYQKI